MMEWRLFGSSCLQNIARKRRTQLFEWLEYYNTEETRIFKALDDWTGKRSKKNDVYPLQLIALTRRGLYTLYDVPSGQGQNEIFTVGLIPQDDLQSMLAGREPEQKPEAQKRKRGRPSITAEQEQEVQTMKGQGSSIREIARCLSISTTTVQKILKRGKKSAINDTAGDCAKDEQRENVSENKAINDTGEGLTPSEARENCVRKELNM